MQYKRGYKMQISGKLVKILVVCSLATNCAPSAEESSEPADRSMSQDSTASGKSNALNATALLKPFEDVAVELQEREVAGQLTSDWSAAWLEIKAARQNRQVTELALLVRSSASSEELLAAGSDVIEAYLESFDTVMKLLDSHAIDGTLDARLLELHSRCLSVLMEIGQSDDRAASQRARDFCCVVKMDPPQECFQWHTAAIWAGSKCVAKGIGLNRWGSTLYVGSCADQPECY